MADPMLLADRRRPTRFVPAAILLGSAGVAAAIDRRFDFGVGELALWGLAALMLALWRTPRIYLTADAVTVRRRGSERRYVWSAVISASWGSAGFYRSGPVLRMQGGPYDMPGPNSPTIVAAMFMPSREVCERWAAACEEHGVAYVNGRRGGML